MTPENNNGSHLPDDDLVLFALQLLPEERMRQALPHLQACQQCRSEVAKIQGDLAAYSTTAEFQAPPPAARERFTRQLAREPRVNELPAFNLRPTEFELRERELEQAREKERELAREKERELAREKERELAIEREREVAREREQEFARESERELAREKERLAQISRPEPPAAPLLNDRVPESFADRIQDRRASDRLQDRMQERNRDQPREPVKDPFEDQVGDRAEARVSDRVEVRTEDHTPGRADNPPFVDRRAPRNSPEPVFSARQSRILTRGTRRDDNDDVEVYREDRRRPRRAPWVLAWTGWAVAAGCSFVAGLQLHQRLQVQGTMATQQAQIDDMQKQTAHAQQTQTALSTLTAVNAMQVALHPTTAVKPVPAVKGTPPPATPEAVAAYLADKGALVFVAMHMQPAPAGKTYELWLLPANGQSPIPAGTFKPDVRGGASVLMPNIPSGVPAKGFGVTVENDGGAQTPTMPIVMS